MPRFIIYLLLLCNVLNTYPQVVVAYTKPPTLTDAVWEELTPHFLPEDHPAKAILDKLFPDSAPLLSSNALRKLDFHRVTPRRSGIIVATHPRLIGYLLKFYLHDFPAPEWALFLQRIRGALLIREAINQHNFKRYLKVPRKWLYPLRPAVLNGEGLHPKHFVMLVENMTALCDNDNQNSYRYYIDKKQLRALYILLKEMQLIDSVYIDNVPFCADGRIAFVDTEHYLQTDQPVRYELIQRFLSKKMQRYWKKLTTGLVR